MLTVIILTNRDDARFKAALASAQPASEVLVIRNNQPIKDFSKVRNQALKQAKNNWVFFLDSDEVIPKNAWQFFENVIKGGKFSGATIRRKDVFHNRTLEFGETGDTRILRLMNKNKAKFVRPVHEVAEVDGEIIDLTVTIKHHAHQNIGGFLQDVNKYGEIEAGFRQEKYPESGKIIFEAITFPTGKFILNYFFKLGFLDGWQGFIYALTMSLHSLFVRIYLYENL